MAAKVQKLTNQVKDIQQGSKSKIFKDISIFVNGYTSMYLFHHPHDLLAPGGDEIARVDDFDMPEHHSHGP